jgi:putative hydrolase of the HAD superfamily
MAQVVGVAPAALVAAYHANWRDRLIRWDVEVTVRILGGTPTDERRAVGVRLCR